jgi:hypothetical protein
MSNPTGASVSRPAAEIEVDQKPAPPDEEGPQADAEDALHRLERLLESLTPSNPPKKIPAPAMTGGSAPRTLPRVEPQAARLAEAIAEARPRRPFLRAALLGVAAAAALGAVVALNGAPGLMRRPPSNGPAAPPTGTLRPSDESVAGSAAAGSPLLKEGADSADVNGADSRAAPQPQAFDPIPDRTAAPPNATPASSAAPTEVPPAFEAAKALAETEPKPSEASATPASSAATKEAPPAAEVVKASAEPEPKAADEATVGAQRLEPEPPTTQSDNPFGVGEALKPNPIDPDVAPLPPIRPRSLGKPAKRTAKPHKEAKVEAEPPAPPPAAQAEAPAAEPAGNPLLRALHDTLK